MIFLLSFITALIPVAIWYTILIRAKRKGMATFFFIMLFFAMVFGFIWFLYFQQSIKNYLFPLIGMGITYLIIGIIIEYGKNFIIRFIGKNYFHDIDDVVDMAFATALGFTLAENFLYFYSMFSLGIYTESAIYIVKEILKQELFILPIHLLTSGFFGYYYGVSLFAKKRNGEKQSHTFKTIQILKGTFISTVLYGTFFMLKELDFTTQDIFNYFGLENFLFGIDEKLLPIISYIFFFIGSFFLFQLIEGKRFIEDPQPLKK